MPETYCAKLERGGNKDMNKLNCFKCRRPFHHWVTQWNTDRHKKERLLKRELIYKDDDGTPICEDCLRERLYDDWDDPDAVMRELPQYDYSYKKWRATIFEVDCPNCGDSNAFHFEEDNQEHTCWSCACYFFTAKQEVTDWWANEDAYLATTKPSEAAQ
jgi:hypothetical protein